MATSVEGELMRALSTRGSWRASDNAFSRSARENDDEEALTWAALEKLPTYDRLRTAILNNGEDAWRHVEVKTLGFLEKKNLVDKLLAAQESENELFVKKLRERIDRVGVELPTIEVRFEDLDVEAMVHVGKRALPTVINFVMNAAEQFLEKLHLVPSRKHVLKILRKVSGVIKPSRMTLLLGPPNSGKTTLLLALSGKLDKSLKVHGRVTYNAHDLTEFVPQRTSAYISQNDLHAGEMTVRETFDFSSRCQGIGSRYEMITELARREKSAQIKPDPDIDAFMKAAAVEGEETNIVTEYMLKVLALDVCADTLVGDNMRRGISGGQKKRVTTGEMLVGPAKALFMDEISTGLDSSTTFQIVKSLRQFVHLLDATMVVSLLQPAPETYELFDDLILLSEGQIIYQGPRDLVLDFFDTQGFRCPPRKGVADFLQEVTSRKDQEQYWADRRMPYRFVPSQEFAEAFKKFHVGQGVAEELSKPFDKSQSHPAALVKEKYGLNKWEILKALTAREILLMKRNSFVYIFKSFQIFFMSLITLTLFLRTEMKHKTLSDANKYMGALFFGLIMLMFNGMAELSLTIARLPVYYKQRDQMLYPSWAFSIPNIITRIPVSLFEAAIWVGMTYYTIGFAPSAGRFFRQFLLMFLLAQMSAGMFRFIAALSRTTIVANTAGSFALLVVFVLGGFVISRDDIHPWWIWAYWSSPMMYGQNALAVNEFNAERWQVIPVNASKTIGNEAMEARGLFTNRNWYWLGTMVQVLFAIFFNVVFTWALGYLAAPGKSQAVLSEDVIEEQNSNRTGEISQRSSSLPQRGRLSDRSFNKGTELKSMSSVSGTPAVTKGMVLPFQPLAMSFKDVNYYVDMPAEMMKQGVTESRLQLLHNVSSAFRPGVLTALVGVSGAGKTTLMDVLAGRKTGGYIEGDIRISGFPKKQETFARISGYCEQTDVHSPNVTVHESLIYSAWLRLSEDIDRETKAMFVEEIMELVELTPLRDAMVGFPGVDGLSTEQRKRLTIAVELVANPSIIFMDEPTSGLDARAAAIVMRTVRNTVDTGRTVVCTIHQPSIDIFEAFDELLLMKRGGRVIYAGTLGRNSEKLIEYFQAIDGVPSIKDGYNPATWMLEVSSFDAETRLGVDFADIYKNSSLYKNNEEMIAQLSIPPPDAKDLSFPTQYPLSFIGQVLACLWKQHRSYWKNPYYVVVRILFTFIVALLFGTMFWDIGSKRGKQQNIINLMGSVYASVLFIGTSNAAGVQPIVATERTVYYRERAAGMYSALPYAFAQVLIELPYVLFQALSYGIIVYAMMNLEWTVVKFFWFIFFLYFTFLYFTLYGMAAVGATPNEPVAAIVSAAFYGIWNLFSGFLIARPDIPVWWRWYYWASPPAWSVYGLVVSQLGDLNDTVELVGGDKESSIKEFLEDSFGFRHDFLGAIAGVHVGLVVVFALVFGLCIKTFNFQNR